METCIKTRTLSNLFRFRSILIWVPFEFRSSSVRVRFQWLWAGKESGPCQTPAHWSATHGHNLWHLNRTNAQLLDCWFRHWFETNTEAHSESGTPVPNNADDVKQIWSLRFSNRINQIERNNSIQMIQIGERQAHIAAWSHTLASLSGASTPVSPADHFLLCSPHSPAAGSPNLRLY